LCPITKILAARDLYSVCLLPGRYPGNALFYWSWNPWIHLSNHMELSLSSLNKAIT
jgi:hypothetical protein